MAEIPGIEDIALSTNGLLLKEQIGELSAAGLRRINLSLDTLRADRFESIARRPGLDLVLRGIDAAIDAGLAPIKFNCVIMRGAERRRADRVRDANEESADLTCASSK